MGDLRLRQTQHDIEVGERLIEVDVGAVERGVESMALGERLRTTVRRDREVGKLEIEADPRRAVDEIDGAGQRAIARHVVGDDACEQIGKVCGELRSRAQLSLLDHHRRLDVPQAIEGEPRHSGQIEVEEAKILDVHPELRVRRDRSKFVGADDRTVQ